MSRDDIPANKPANRRFEEVLHGYMKRRTVLRGGLSAAAVIMTVFSGLAPDGRRGDGKDRGRGNRSRPMDFEPLPNSGGCGSEPTISSDWVRWRDRAA